MSEAEMKKELLRIADYICDNPEVGLKEYKASVFLSEYLRQNGFSVELGVGGLDTAFRAVWENGTGGPSIGFLCEYDALEGIGHGCGHHLQGPSVAGAAVALRETLSPEQPCTIVIYGTPAEETAAEYETKILEDTSLSQGELNELSAQMFDLWDIQLNEVWAVLQQMLSQTDMEALTAEELERLRSGR